MNSLDKPTPIASLPDNLEHLQRSRSAALGHIPCRGSSVPSAGPEPACSRADNCQRCGRWALSAINLQHPHPEYKAALTTGQEPTGRRPRRCQTNSGRLPPIARCLGKAASFRLLRRRSVRWRTLACECDARQFQGLARRPTVQSACSGHRLHGASLCLGRSRSTLRTATASSLISRLSELVVEPGQVRGACGDVAGLSLLGRQPGPRHRRTAR